MQFPITIELHRSRTLSLLLLLLHFLAAASLLAWPLPLVLRSFSLVPLAVSACFVFRPRKILALRLFERGQLDCRMFGGGWLVATILPETTVFDRLVVLRLRINEEPGVNSLVLITDHFSLDDFRILRLWLRWRKAPKEVA